MRGSLSETPARKGLLSGALHPRSALRFNRQDLKEAASVLQSRKNAPAASLQLPPVLLRRTDPDRLGRLDLTLVAGSGTRPSGGGHVLAFLRVTRVAFLVATFRGCRNRR